MVIKKHSAAEISAKLAQASAWIAEGKSQATIAKELGISVMTFHRWKKQYATGHNSQILAPLDEPQSDPDAAKRLQDLQIENTRLRRLVTDLMLEKMALEEALGQRTPLKQGAGN